MIKRLSSDSAVRNSLVAASDGILRKAGESLAEPAEKQSLATEALLAMRAELINQGRTNEARILDGSIPSFKTWREGFDWLQGRIKDSPGVKPSDLEATYSRHFDAVVKDYFKKVGENSARLASSIEKSSLGFVQLE